MTDEGGAAAPHEHNQDGSALTEMGHSIDRWVDAMGQLVNSAVQLENFEPRYGFGNQNLVVVSPETPEDIITKAREQFERGVDFAGRTGFCLRIDMGVDGVSLGELTEVILAVVEDETFTNNEGLSIGEAEINKIRESGVQIEDDHLAWNEALGNLQSIVDKDLTLVLDNFGDHGERYGKLVDVVFNRGDENKQFPVSTVYAWMSKPAYEVARKQYGSGSPVIAQDYNFIYSGGKEFERERADDLVRVIVSCFYHLDENEVKNGFVPIDGSAGKTTALHALERLGLKGVRVVYVGPNGEIPINEDSENVEVTIVDEAGKLADNPEAMDTIESKSDLTLHLVPRESYTSEAVVNLLRPRLQSGKLVRFQPE